MYVFLNGMGHDQFNPGTLYNLSAEPSPVQLNVRKLPDIRQLYVNSMFDGISIYGIIYVRKTARKLWRTYGIGLDKGEIF